MQAEQTLADLRQGLHVSYSQIRSYMICPAKYAHTYVWGTEPSHKPAALVFGSAVHHALAHYYLSLLHAGEKIGQGDFLETFRLKMDEELDAPVPIAFDEDDGEGALIDQGINLLTMFHDKADAPTVLAVEQPFSVDLYDPLSGEVMDLPMVGAMDLIIQGATRPEIVEHKTAGKRYAQWQLDFETQPSVYVYAAQQLGIGDVDVRYQLLIKTKTPQLQQCPIDRTTNHVNEMLATFCSVLRAIEAGHFYRNRSWACSDCQFRYQCDRC